MPATQFRLKCIVAPLVLLLITAARPQVLQAENPPAAVYVDSSMNQNVHGLLASPGGNSQPFTYKIAQPPKHGHAVVVDAASGAWNYVPDKGYLGNDEFRINATIGRTTQVTRIVLLVNYAPSHGTYYVDAVLGSDTNPGTVEKPFASIQAAHDVTRPGDTVLVREGTNLVYDYNLYFDGRTPDFLGPHDGIADPQFVKAAKGDFHLLPASPAVDSGTPGLGIVIDHDGLPRPAGSGFDRGAFELPQH